MKQSETEYTMRHKTTSRNMLGGTLLGHLAAILAVAMWGYSFVSSKVLLENGLGPVQIYVCRFVLAYILVVAISHRRLWASTWREEGMFCLCGLCAGSVYFIAENIALEYTLTTNVSLLTSMSPLVTAMLVGLVYKTEKLGIGTGIGSGWPSSAWRASSSTAAPRSKCVLWATSCRWRLPSAGPSTHSFSDVSTPTMTCGSYPARHSSTACSRRYRSCSSSAALPTPSS
ncbi:MAG: DMT family transporter [Muribaculaceae bacterium]|nr:DMT family transporter [Muribaculaceae bacterium]